MDMSRLALNRFLKYTVVKYADQGVKSYSVLPGGMAWAMSMSGGGKLLVKICMLIHIGLCIEYCLSLLETVFQ
jgi:hypothetical protein